MWTEWTNGVTTLCQVNLSPVPRSFAIHFSVQKFFSPIFVPVVSPSVGFADLAHRKNLCLIRVIREIRG